MSRYKQPNRPSRTVGNGKNESNTHSQIPRTTVSKKTDNGNKNTRRPKRHVVSEDSKMVALYKAARESQNVREKWIKTPPVLFQQVV
ncbi:hypothetical protein JR316_0004130 [Psilocybe cubensis]|uniref:Uncharacterized protein n=2 Tax=Psilocybe cubensis TaxID=181762 RepID=A0ACB8HA08_PSICU|nr:hypothetical protein JR316_0004130 [Psilocybe cubensis]KAH9484648.1 hypothetical protein JR316_0004130 [Psilocybe cubensis]